MKAFMLYRPAFNYAGEEFTGKVFSDIKILKKYIKDKLNYLDKVYDTVNSKTSSYVWRKNVLYCKITSPNKYNKTIYNKEYFYKEVELNPDFNPETDVDTFTQAIAKHKGEAK